MDHPLLNDEMRRREEKRDLTKGLGTRRYSPAMNIIHLTLLP